MRRLPVYLLLDCSESMAGPGIEELQKGVNRLIDELQLNPQALETAHLSIITFSKTAKVVVPLTEISSFQTPSLRIKTGTALGSALRLLAESIEKDVRKTTRDTKGDYRPLVFIFSDGQPTDKWEDACAALSSTGPQRIANIYAFGCGPDADPQMLREITDIVFTVKDLSPEGWQKVFVWLSASVSAASVAMTGGSDEELVLRLPDFPTDVIEATLPTKRISSGPPHQLFLHAQCANDGSPYLMRFLRKEGSSKYGATAAHPLDEVEKEADDILPPVNSNDLLGLPPCPYCGNNGAVVCRCDTIICISGGSGNITTCPNCRSPVKASTEGKSFGVKQAQG
ncbi:VWA domain-containing protein [Akkermansiaceae bacterium]|nr:VWA domain-containing protein [Akkermansiaceae bacterium]